MASGRSQRLKNQIKARMHKSLKAQGGAKHSSTEKSLGCTPDQLKDWLQSQFKNGMNWNNQGTYWQVDHIVPIASFDITDPAQQKLAFHYTNLQPLETKKNQLKGAKLINAQLHMHL